MLSEWDLKILLENRSLQTHSISQGAVVLLWEGMVLGRGIVRAGGELVSEIANAQRSRLREILAKRRGET
jgi:hypothetical protein